MATYVERPGSVLVRVRMRGVTAVKTFPNKTKARDWATKKEASIIDKTLGVTQDMSFGEVVEAFYDRLDPSTQRHDLSRLKAFVRDAALAKVRLKDLNPTHVAEWHIGGRFHLAQFLATGDKLGLQLVVGDLCRHAQITQPERRARLGIGYPIATFALYL